MGSLVCLVATDVSVEQRIEVGKPELECLRRSRACGLLCPRLFFDSLEGRYQARGSSSREVSRPCVKQQNGQWVGEPSCLRRC